MTEIISPLFPPQAFISFSPDHRGTTNSHLYTSQASFQDSEWMSEALTFVATSQFRSEFSRGEGGPDRKGYMHKLSQIHLSFGAFHFRNQSSRF